MLWTQQRSPLVPQGVLELGCLLDIVLSWGEGTELLHLCIKRSLELGFPWKATSSGRQPTEAGHLAAYLAAGE